MNLKYLKLDVVLPKVKEIGMEIFEIEIRPPIRKSLTDYESIMIRGECTGNFALNHLLRQKKKQKKKKKKLF